MFSVIIPLYNKAPFVEAAVRSVLEQSFQDFEVWLIDDGSTDGSSQLADSLASEKVHVIHQKNAGVSAARNLGISHAGHEYVCFLDADDIWLPEHLETLKGLIEDHPGMGLYSTLNSRVYDDNHESSYLNTELPEVFHDYLGYALNNPYIIHTDCICIKKTVFDTVGLFTPGERLGEDENLWARIALCYDIAVRQKITSKRFMPRSEASKTVSCNENWSFPALAQELIKNNPVDREKKDSLYRYIALYRSQVCISFCKAGDKASARKYYKLIEKDYLSRKRLLKTRFALICPTRILNAGLRAARG